MARCEQRDGPIYAYLSTLRDFAIWNADCAGYFDESRLFESQQIQKGGKDAMLMKARKLGVLLIVLGFMALFTTPASANVLTSATATANCQGYNLTVNAKDLTVGTKYTIDYTFTLTCNKVVTTVPGSITFTATATTATETAKGTFPGLSGNCVVTGTATLTSDNSTVPITINGASSCPLTCGVITSSCVAIKATQGVAIKPVTLTASGGTGGPYTFTATGLPSGLSISTSGTISGTPMVSGTFSYTVTITDSEGNTGKLNCSLTVCPPLSVTCQAVNMGDVGVPFNSGPMTVTGGTAPYMFSIVSGTLPAGLTLNTSTGAVTGTPTAAGTFTVKVTDANGGGRQKLHDHHRSGALGDLPGEQRGRSGSAV